MGGAHARLRTPDLLHDTPSPCRPGPALHVGFPVLWGLRDAGRSLSAESRVSCPLVMYPHALRLGDQVWSCNCPLLQGGPGELVPSHQTARSISARVAGL